MYIARFEFLPEHADSFCEDGQMFSEIQFDDIMELVEFTKEIEGCLHEVLVFDGRQVISLREVSEKN